jgi:hypothetical protein
MVRPPSRSALAGRLDGPTTRGPGSCPVLLATAALGGTGKAAQVSVAGTGASWQPPHVSGKYSKSDHLLSRVRPRYGARVGSGNG